MNLLNRLLRTIRNESGQALPIVLAMMMLGGLTVVPSLNYMSTNINAERAMEKRVKANYAAEAGISDAIWRIRAGSITTTPSTFQLPNINGMVVNVAVNAVTTIAGQEIGPTGVHGGWLRIDKTITYSAGIYTFTFSFTNNGEGNMRIEDILIDLPSLVEYVIGSTSGEVTNNDPFVIGTSEIGITLHWALAPSYYIIGKNDTVSFSYQLSGPAGVPGIEGHSVVKATREDVGTVWDSDSRPYSITAQAFDSHGTLITAIKAGIWKAPSIIEIACWQINP